MSMYGMLEVHFAYTRFRILRINFAGPDINRHASMYKNSKILSIESNYGFRWIPSFSWPRWRQYLRFSNELWTLLLCMYVWNVDWRVRRGIIERIGESAERKIKFCHGSIGLWLVQITLARGVNSVIYSDCVFTILRPLSSWRSEGQ